MQNNVHRPGIEPGPPAWQASILPLNQRCSRDMLQNLINKFPRNICAATCTGSLYFCSIFVLCVFLNLLFFYKTIFFQKNLEN